MSIIVISPKVGEESAKLLAKKLKASYENPYETDKRDFRDYDVIFNYGFSRPIKGNTVFNKNENINKARCKITTLSLLKDDDITVEFTQDKEEAIKWIKQHHIAVARDKAKATQGKGLAYCYTLEDIDNLPAKFWTKYYENTHEFRINTWRDKALAVYTKKHDVKEGTFSFVKFDGVENHPQLQALVQKVYEKIGLDFSGIDVLRDEKGDLKLLEVNSAPILPEEEVNLLVKAVKEAIV